MGYFDMFTDWIGDWFDSEDTVDTSGYYDENTWERVEYEDSGSGGYFNNDNTIFSMGSLLDEEDPGLLDTAGGYLNAVEKFAKDNPMASKAIAGLLGSYFSGKQAEAASEEEYKRKMELMKLQAALSSGGGGGPPAPTTTTAGSPGKVTRR